MRVFRVRRIPDRFGAISAKTAETKGRHTEMPRKKQEPLPQPVFGEPVFNEGVPTPDPAQFKVTPTDANLYTKSLDKLLIKDVVPFDQASGQPSDVYSLADAWGPNGPAVIQAVNQAQTIAFHMIGDSGASKLSNFPAMIKVSDAVTNDFHTSTAANRPSFLFHLGDLVYNFGESEYYYDQFYEPFRNYPAPIFAIPGNHDSFIVPGTAKGSEPLTIFTRNFCSPTLVLTNEAASLHRTAMMQPGVYFTLDAPFVRIIGLFSNALEDPGVISSENNKWKQVPDYQLAFLTAQLQRIKQENYQGAVLLAVHHPPFSYAPPPATGASGGKHPGNSVMLADIDTICKQQGVYPHAFLSGHEHNYQRFTRTLNFGGKNYSVPFVVCGDSGHNVDSVVNPKLSKSAPEPGDNVDVTYLEVKPVVQSTGLILNKHDQSNSGYLRVAVNATQLAITFNPVSKTGAPVLPDTVTVNLASHSIV
jgi:Calcineurin-like phosphoesterase